MTANQRMETLAEYLDMQAEVGITKHIGGFKATDELLAMCQIEKARDVLYVGTGIGVGPAYIAKKFRCWVVGVDISEKMIQWSRLRAKEDHVEDLVELKTGDILSLPFQDNLFDVVLVESVVAFVGDKRRAIAECVRVTRPGGFVGINESFWLAEADQERLLYSNRLNADIPSENVLRQLWAESGLQERIVKVYPLKAMGRAYARANIEWVGWRWALRGFGRLTSWYIRVPAARKAIREMFDSGMGMFDCMGYGLLVGKK